MSMIRWVKTRTERYRRARKGLSTIMANLLMLIIVVFLSSLLFVWAINSFSTYQGGAGYWFSSNSLANQERLSVENVYFTNTSPSSTQNKVVIYYRNVGTVPVTLGTVYLSSPTFTVNQSPNAQLTINRVANVTLFLGLLGGYQWQSGTLYTVKLATIRGTTVTTTWVA